MALPISSLFSHLGNLITWSIAHHYVWFGIATCISWHTASLSHTIVSVCLHFDAVIRIYDLMEVGIWLEAVGYQPWWIWPHKNEYVHHGIGREWKWTERTSAFDLTTDFPQLRVVKAEGLSDVRSIIGIPNGRATFWNAWLHARLGLDGSSLCQINWAWPNATINLSVEIRIIAKQSRC